MPLEHLVESQMGCMSIIIVDATSKYSPLLRLVMEVTSMLCLMKPIQHGKLSLRLRPLHTGIRTEHPRRLLLPPLFQRKGKHRQFLKRHSLILTRETHVRMILPLEWQQRLNRRREWLRRLLWFRDSFRVTLIPQALMRVLFIKWIMVSEIQIVIIANGP